MPAQNQSARKIDANGFLSVKGCPLSSFGIFDYSAAQIGLPGDPYRIVKVYRPESAVNDPELIASLQNMPFIVDHEMLSGFENDTTTTAPEDYGVDGVLTSNVYYAKPWLRGDLMIYSRKAQKELKKKDNLSLGYSCDFELNPGTFEGQPYEVVQTNMRGNHIALVDEGRVPGARVLDGRRLVFDHLNFDQVRPSDEDQHMTKRALDASAVLELKALFEKLNGAFQKFLSEESAEPEHQASGESAVASGEGGGSSEGDMQPLNADDPDGAEGAGAAGGVEGGGEELPALLSQVEQLLASIRQAIGGEGADGEGMTTGEGQVSDETQTNVAEGEGQAVDGEGGEGNPEGLTASGAARASEGPAAGKHPHAGDAAIRRFYADSAAKDRIYHRLSKVVGAFDHSAMAASDVYAYGLKQFQKQGKLTHIKAADASIVRSSIDAYLDGMETAQKTHRTNVQASIRKTVAGDSALPSDDSLDAYLAGSK
jgi:hypothetical protein